MTEDSSRPSGGGQDKIVAGIEQARRDLANSVQALAAKADVPARVREKAGKAREKAGQAREKAGKARDKAGQTIPAPARDTVVRTTRQATAAAERRPAILYAAAGLCAAAGLWLLRRGRGRSRGRRRWT